uniref:Uncharacterized protein n=1 Tax=Arundo donax TaxID=35708 RepID=A0A0A9G3Y7_ARUDO
MVSYAYCEQSRLVQMGFSSKTFEVS